MVGFKKKGAKVGVSDAADAVRAASKWRRSSLGKGCEIMTSTGKVILESEIRDIKGTKMYIQPRKQDTIDDFEDEILMEPDTSIAKYEKIIEVEGAPMVVTALALAPDGQRAIYGSVNAGKGPNKGKAPVAVLDIQEDTQAYLWMDNMVADLQLSADGEEFAAADVDGRVAVACARTALPRFRQRLGEKATCLSYLKYDVPAGKGGREKRLVAVGDPYGTVRVAWVGNDEHSIKEMPPGGGELAAELPPLEQKEEAAEAGGGGGGSSGDGAGKGAARAAPSEGNEEPAAAAPGGANVAVIQDFGGKAIHDVALARPSSGNGVLLAVVSESGYISCYDVLRLRPGGYPRAAEPALVFRLPHPGCQAVALSADGRTLASGGRNRDVLVLGVEEKVEPSGDGGQQVDWDEELLDTFSAQEAVVAVWLSPDGGQLVVGDDAGHLGLFDVFTGGALYTARRGNRIKRVQGCANQRYIATAGFDSQIAIYDVTKGVACVSSTKMPKLARSVSFSKDGKTMAVSNHAFEIIVYDVHYGQVLFEVKREKEVWCVALSDDGKTLAAAGYDCICKLYSVERGVETGIEFKTDFFIWSVALLHNEDHQLIAVGDWTGKVALYSSADGTKHCELKIEDRVFGVDITRDGKFLAVGGRNNLAAVYDVSRPAEGAKLKQRFHHEDRVYTVAISPDGRHLAAAGMDKAVTLYDLEGGLELAKFLRDGHINLVRFSWDGRTLAAVGKDGLCVLYDVGALRPCLVLDQHCELNAVALSAAGQLALAGGDRVVVYGKTVHNYDFRDRPAYAVCVSILRDPAALRVLVEEHPTVVHLRDPETGKTLLQVAVEKQDERAVEALLQSRARIGLLRDKWGNTPMSVAVKAKSKGIVQLILQAVLDKRVSNSPGSMAAITELKIFEEVVDSEQLEMMTVFESLGQHMPDVLLYFLTELKEEPCEPQVIGHMEEAPIRDSVYLACSKRVPENIWAPFIATLEVTDDDFGLKCEAKRVPIRNFSENVPLEEITKYAEKTGDFKVFRDGSCVSAIIHFKWSILRKAFLKHFVIYMGLLVFAIVWSYCVSRTRLLDWGELIQDGYGLVAIICTPVIFVGTAYHLRHEVEQLMDEVKDGRSYRSTVARYFDNFWNFLDLPSFFLIGITIILFLARVQYMHFTNSMGILGLCLKVLYFMRAFGHWGMVVRTLQKIVGNVVNLFHILVIIIFAFAMSFMTLYLGGDGDNQSFSDPVKAFLSTTLLVYGEFGPLEDEISDMAWTKIQQLIVLVLFEVFTCFAVLALLNVVIANMTDSYEEVKENAQLETKLELAKIIVELEKMEEFETQSWLHSLKPVETLLTEETSEERQDRLLAEIEQREIALNGKVDAITKQLYNLGAKMEKLLASKKSS